MAKDGRHSAPGTAAEQSKKKPRLLRRLVTLALLAGVVLAVAALTTMGEDSVHFASLRRWLMYGETSGAGDAFTYAADPDNRFARLGDRLLVAGPNVLRLLQSNGAAVCEEAVRMASPQISVGARQAAVCDVGGSALYLLDRNGLRRTMNTENGLCYYSARLNGSDYLAVTEQKGGFKASLSVYNSTGRRVFQFDSYDSYLSDAIVTEDCRYAAAVSLEARDGAFASTLLVYDLLSAELVGSRPIRDGLVLDLNSNRDRLLAVCDRRFSIATTAGESLLDRAFGNLYLHGYALTGEDFSALLLGRYQSGNVCTLTTYDMDGAEIASLDLTEEVLDLDAQGDRLAVLFSDSLVVYTRDLQEYARLEDTGYAGTIEMGADGSVLLISSTEARRFLP